MSFNNSKNKIKTAKTNYFSAGVIPKYNDYFLLVLEKKKNNWSFPKGKKDLNDFNSLNTALRELKEETNIHVDYNSKNIKNSYMIKKCIFYEYEFSTVPEILYVESVEVKEIKWFKLDEINSIPLNYLTKKYFEIIKKK
jgi:8-oxo-dGTP pyrophosphatase MutT (NUDIX family)